jgi:hypothetical protein
MFSKVSESLRQDSQETDVALIQLLRDPLNGENQLGGDTRDHNINLVILESTEGDEELYTEHSISLDGIHKIIKNCTWFKLCCHGICRKFPQGLQP